MRPAEPVLGSLDNRDSNETKVRYVYIIHLAVHGT